MKLLNRTSLRYFSLSIPIVLVTMTIFYFLIRYFNQKHVDELLKKEHQIIVKKSQKIHDYFIEDELSDELMVSAIPTDSVVKDHYSTIMMYDSLEDQNEPHRQLETMQVIASKNYHIIVRKSLVENTTLFYSITIVMFMMVLVLSLSFIILNRFLAEKIWSPFHLILKNLGNYTIGKEYEKQKKLSINEFIILDNSISKMTQRINKEYFIHKDYIDIISHEYRTPLSVINNEAEMLCQNEELKEEDLKKIGNIIEYVNRLSRMNQSLLLLSRIDNKQFNDNQEIDLQLFISKIAEDKKERVQTKGIEWQMDLQKSPSVLMNGILGTILFTNFVQNAIRYNKKTDGWIEISLKENKFSIKNASEKEGLAPELLYKKFNKNKENPHSIGLGLSIIKAICTYNNLEIIYFFDSTKKHHCFEIQF